MRFALILCAAALCAAAAGCARESSTAVAPASTPASAGTAAITPRPGKAAIASAHGLATEAGFEVLAKGGNAFDAAIAVGAVLAVVEPQSSGIGGGGFFLLHRAADGRDVFLDARETAPAASRSELWADAEGRIDRDKSINGPLSAGIPGEPAAYDWLARHYGRLPLADSLAPAIRIAREGFPVYARFGRAIGMRKSVLERWPAGKTLFLPAGEIPAEGSTWRNPDLAATLELIAADGAAAFYQGAFAERLVKAVNAAGGIWTRADLAAYAVKERTPIAIDYRGWRIVTAPPPSSGGVALAEMLNILGGYDLARRNRVERVHLTIEAMRRAYRDRAEYLGDPDFVSMPIAELTSPLYAAGLRASIHPAKATPSDALPGYMSPAEGEHTTHYSIMDADGNLAAVTKTVNLTLGSAFVVDGTGFVLNNEMDDFALLPGQPNAFGLVGGEANAPKAGRRPLSSMTPSFVIGEDRVGVIGTPGGSRIITMVLEGILAWIDGEAPAAVVARPRYHHQYLPDVVSAEPGAFSRDEVRALGAMGHIVNEGERTWGLMNMVGWNRRTGEIGAGSDPREPMSSAGTR
ncbi:MAG TPA: gamma-glutamyltransferase [Dokdonella sp.]|uniref:gamma-glutamyltransferase n=1 Tax=Dokdonella sp. TaxID=2291710 RepID=UPI0025BB731A|nr:gamma-glutamyltransferase [Dokdonella sp.]MBX3691930.1 gamma-glutamyltransferase [Dokdonella sp.]MCW5568172.1 gamma-glutamyltransferase [Dokdonella sp.]HNR91867.1 gamma-glutamyltransferase [Dokdonella sp.]